MSMPRSVGWMLRTAGLLATATVGMGSFIEAKDVTAYLGAVNEAGVGEANDAISATAAVTSSAATASTGVAEGADVARASSAPRVTDAAEVVAGAPSDLSVTIYRAPTRSGGSIDLDRLGGFALISETRTIHLLAGESRVRFEGVADGIQPESAIVTGLASGIIEKNLDGQVLSPSALLAVTLGKPVVLLRTNAKTGVTERLPGTIKSDTDGVVFETAQGIEALRCSGLSESFSFDTAAGLSATPTLSVGVRTTQPTTAVVTLSYLAGGFDWAADYSANLSPDGKSLDLGAWVTLANGNGIGFPAARTQVVAGKLNRETGEGDNVEGGDDGIVGRGEPILARCWPRGSTSDSAAPVYIANASPYGFHSAYLMPRAMAMAASAPLAEVMLTAAKKVAEEQLGDLKLYRVPDRTTVASRQSKQVRLLDKKGVSVQKVYGADLAGDESAPWMPAALLLRTKNDRAHGLGLPLPSGRVSVFATDGRTQVLENEANLRDLAIDEDVEIELGTRSDVQLRAVEESAHIDTAHATILPLIPGVAAVRSAKVDKINRVEISNATMSVVDFELRLRVEEGTEIFRADHALGWKNGRPVFRLAVPAGGRATVRYQTRSADRRVLNR
jgi:hypothetical protein